LLVATIEMIQKLKFLLLCSPAYSPDLIPSDYTIFSDRLKMHYVDADLQMMVPMMWYICALHATENILHEWHQEAHGP
jgi:hypothetical protein